MTNQRPVQHKSRRSFVGQSAAALIGGATAFRGHATPGAAAAPVGRFDGKVVLITGATSGIGEASARLFAAEGARVGFCGRRRELGSAVEADIRAAGGEALYVPADVRDESQIAAFVDTVTDRYGGLDIAFNNAGVQHFAPLHEQRIEDWDDTLLTNARGVFLAMKYEIPVMLAAGGGVILVTSSSAVTVTRPELAAYAASKQALQGIVQSAALEYGPRGIRVNAVMPGITDTPMIRPAGLPDAVWAMGAAELGQRNVDGLQRIATPDEIARVVLSLASDDFAYVTGASIFADGGLSAGRPLLIPQLPG